jgi:hypothetical protein
VVIWTVDFVASFSVPTGVEFIVIRVKLLLFPAVTVLALELVVASIFIAADK